MKNYEPLDACVFHGLDLCSQQAWKPICSMCLHWDFPLPKCLSMPRSQNWSCLHLQARQIQWKLLSLQATNWTTTLEPTWPRTHTKPSASYHYLSTCVTHTVTVVFCEHWTCELRYFTIGIDINDNSAFDVSAEREYYSTTFRYCSTCSSRAETNNASFDDGITTCTTLDDDKVKEQYHKTCHEVQSYYKFAKWSSLDSDNLATGNETPKMESCNASWVQFNCWIALGTWYLSQSTWTSLAVDGFSR